MTSNELSDGTREKVKGSKKEAVILINKEILNSKDYIESQFFKSVLWQFTL